MADATLAGTGGAVGVSAAVAILAALAAVVAAAAAVTGGAAVVVGAAGAAGVMTPKSKSCSSSRNKVQILKGTLLLFFVFNEVN